MKPSDIQYGETTTVEIRPMSELDFGRYVQPLTQVFLLSSELSDNAILQVGETSWNVEGIDAHHQELLNRLVVKNLPNLAWVGAAFSNKQNQESQSLLLEIREFPVEYIWSDAVEIGLDEKIIEAIRLKRKRLVNIGAVIGWLEDKVLVDLQGESQLVLLSGSPTPQADQRSNFRLHGKGVAVDVARDKKGRLFVTRVVEAKRPQGNDRRPIYMVKGRFKFVDYTIAGCFRGAARSQLDQIVADADSYLGVWKEYNKLERQSILDKAREFGWLKYSSCEQLSGGCWRFNLENSKSLEAGIRFLEDNETVDLEVAVHPPAELVEAGDAGESREADAGMSSRDKRIFAGECVYYDRKFATLDIRTQQIGVDEDNPPPEKGVVFVSLSGDRKRLERRENAQALIAAAECPMPQLGLLIESKMVQVRRRKHWPALSAAARKVFGGDPTDRQVEALRVALNTPDIALIQGPPGTGKTRVIAALQTRLAEINEDTEGIAGRALLTSYQHDAVENVASATEVYGLPAIKVGRKRGTDNDADGFEHWRRDMVEAASAELAKVKETPAAVALNKCRDLAVAYLRSPSRVDDVANLLDEVYMLSAGHVPEEIHEGLLRLKQQIQKTSSPTSVKTSELELALKAVRGLRTDPVTFSDDGPDQAYKVLRRLAPLSILEDADKDFLGQAADWDKEGAPEFLNELQILKESLIDQLLPDERPTDVPLVNIDVEMALNSVIYALRERVRVARGGANAVLAEYRDDLETDQRGVRNAVRRYTFVLAATCQQAVGYQMSQHKGEAGIFDTVVVDEAARANPLDLFIPMSLAEQRIVLVGDHRQLPHLLEYEIERDIEKSLSGKTEELLKKSLFQRLFKQMQEREKTDGIKRTVTLNKQYRMHPVLGQFISDTFYQGHGEAFTSGRDASEFHHGLKRYEGAVAAWAEMPFAKGREHGKHSKRRRAEARWIAREAKQIMEDRPDLSVGVISFYSAQVDELLMQMETVGLAQTMDDGILKINDAWRERRDPFGKLKERLRVGTVDAFQGKEFDVVFLSMTRSNDLSPSDKSLLRKKYGHLMLENRLCVAMSRQQRLLIVVGDPEMVRGDAAEEAIPSLAQFYHLCGGPHGVKFLA
jgi:hypothetical protein